MTAVEFLEEQIERFHNWRLNPTFDEIELRKSIQQAKEIERKQKDDYAVEFFKWAMHKIVWNSISIPQKELLEIYKKRKKRYDTKR